MLEHVPIGQTAEGARGGDIILCHRKGFPSWCIRVGEGFKNKKGVKVSHIACVEDKNTLIEALTHGVKRTPLEAYRDIEYWIARTNLKGDDQLQAVAFLRSCLNQKYGFAIDLSIAIRFLTPGRSSLWFGANGTEICSGLAGQMLCRGWANFKFNPASLSPDDLWQYYE